MHTFYTLEGAHGPEATRSPRFEGGSLVVNVVDMPIKCPVAPLEFCFLADWHLRSRGIREDIADHLRDAAGRRVHQAASPPRASARC